MSRVRPLLAVLVLAIVALSGCVGDEEVSKDDVKAQAEECVATGVCGAKAVLDETGRDLRTDLTAADELPAPTWKVGDVFEQHVYYGNADQNGEHIVTMVVDDAGDCYTVATTSQNAAKQEAIYDLPILGCIKKEHLQTSAFDAQWDWMYDFPLTDGKSWEGKIDFLYNWNDQSLLAYDKVTFTATYASKIDTPKGDFPGFLVSGTLEDGAELLSYNYVPAVGWFSHFWIYDLNTPETEDVIFHAMSMGRSTGYTGNYYIDEVATSYENEMFPAAPVFAAVFGQQVVAPEAPADAFVVPDDATYLMGVVVAFACGGRSHISLIYPDNQKKDFVHEHSDPAACAEPNEFDPSLYTVHFVDEEAKWGSHTLALVPAAVIAGAFMWLVAIKEVQHELTAEDLPAEEAAAETE